MNSALCTQLYWEGLSFSEFNSNLYGCKMHILSITTSSARSPQSFLIKRRQKGADIGEQCTESVQRNRTLAPRFSLLSFFQLYSPSNFYPSLGRRRCCCSPARPSTAHVSFAQSVGFLFSSSVRLVGEQNKRGFLFVSAHSAPRGKIDSPSLESWSSAHGSRYRAVDRSLLFFFFSWTGARPKASYSWSLLATSKRNSARSLSVQASARSGYIRGPFFLQRAHLFLSLDGPSAPRFAHGREDRDHDAHCIFPSVCIYGRRNVMKEEEKSMQSHTGGECQNQKRAVAAAGETT